MAETVSRFPPAVVVPVLIGTALFTLTVTSLVPSPLDAARGGSKTEVFPAQTTAHAAVVIETAGTEAELRRQMRTKNGVAELHTGTIRFSQAPTGSFGFIAPQSLGMALVTQSPDLAMERTTPAANAYEIHKLADGSGMLVGFLGEDLLAQVAPSERPHHIRIALYSNATDKASRIVAVPLIKLMVDQMPVRIDRKKTDSPVKLEMDLQSTANRKSPVMVQ